LSAGVYSLKTITFILLSLLFFSTACQPYLKKPEAKPAPSIRVLVSEIAETDTLVFDGIYTLHSEEANYELGKKNNQLIVSVLKNGYKLSNSSRLFTFRDVDKIRLTSPENTSSFQTGKRLYKGSIVISKKPGGKILLVNKLNLEDYLAGVVPSEMPSYKTGYLEALKAQAICARTYALKKMLLRKNAAFDVYTDVWDQVYKGKQAETPLANEALSATRGDVLMNDDSLATIYYHSTCGGLTESAQNVWQVSSFPYLQSQKDILGDGFACSVSPLFRWQRSFGIAQLDSLFNNSYNKSYLAIAVEDTTSLLFKATVLSRTAQGRVQQMQISYGDTSVVLNGYSIRRFFSDSDSGDLKSRFFSISSTDSTILINGGGYGHGVGMCQWGALNMSEKGFKYYDILVNKYFKGTYLKKVY